MNTVDINVDVGRLLAFALDVTASPSAGRDAADYARLVRRYLEDAPFRARFSGLVEGVGCQVATADLHVGVVLCSRPEGPWAWPAKAGDLPWNAFEGTSDRAARALVVIALLAYIAPSAADFDDVLSDAAVVLPAVGVRDLEQFIRDFCEQREEDAVDPTGDEDTRPLWWHWLQLPADAPTSKRISRKTTTYVVHDVLSYLRRSGLMIDTTPTRGAADKSYRPRRRLLHHYRDLLLDDAYIALRAHSSGPGVASEQARADGPEGSEPSAGTGGDEHAGEGTRSAGKARR